MSSALHLGARRRPAIAGLLVAAAAITMLAMTSSAQAAKGMEVSLQDEGVFTTRSTPFNEGVAYSLMDRLQVTRMRFNALWGSLNDNAQCASRTKPGVPIYDFTNLDRAINSVRAQGIRVLLSITGPAPAWANSKRRCEVADGADFNPNAREFGKFASLVAKRYKGKVDQYSVWNEPNRKGWLQPVRTSGTQYQKLYQEGYRAIKRADKKAKVFIGELAPYASKPGVAQDPLDFLRQLTCTNSRFQPTGRRCRALRADGFAHHPYDFARRPTQKHPSKDAVTIANLGSLTSALDRLRRLKRLVPNRGSRMDLHLTEYGYFASKEPGGRAKVFPESTRGKYLVQGFKIAQKNPRVRQMLQFLLVQYPGAGTGNAGFDFDTSLVRLDGRPFGAYDALASWATSAAKKNQIKKAR